MKDIGEQLLAVEHDRLQGVPDYSARDVIAEGRVMLRTYEENEMLNSWLEKLDIAITLALGEELPEMQRSQLMSEPVNLED